MESTWEILYRRFRRLKSEWANWKPMPLTRQAFNFIMDNGRKPVRDLKWIAELGHPEPPKALINASIELAQNVKGMPTGYSEDDPFDDVYQAALAMERYYDWQGDDVVRRAYRGQRNATWATTAKLFRNRVAVPMEGSDLAAEFQHEFSRIGALLRDTRAAGLITSDDEGLAVVQHYSSEIGLGTWLVDFTYDPFVALFFASDGGQSGDLGTVFYVGLDEWETYCKNGCGLGTFKAIEEPSVPRIRNQRGLFLEAPREGLLELFVPFALYFRQVPGLVFEDESRLVPVSRSAICPENDEYKSFLLKASRASDAAPSPILPPSDGSPFNGDDFLKLGIEMYERYGTRLRPDHAQIVRRAVSVFARMQSIEYRKRIEVGCRSLQHLEEIVDGIRDRGRETLQEVFAYVHHRADRGTRQAIEELIERAHADFTGSK